MTDMTIITVKDHAYRIGDVIFYRTYDTIWWKRLFYFITFREPPMITKKLRLSSASATTLTVE